MKARSLRFALLGAVAAILGGCGSRVGSGSEGPVLAAPARSELRFGEVGDFRLTERSGREIARADLLGKPWLASFLFTRCSTICPGITRELGRAQEALAELPVRIVSFSVDPEHDTPAVLAEYATRVAGADPERWLFLTGDQAAIYSLIEKSFLLAVAMDPEQDPGLRVTHSSQFVVVDAEGELRGYYDGSTRAGTDAAVARLRFLAGARDPAPQATLNACLNAGAALLLLLGLLAIRRRRRELHARLMVGAFGLSALFLASYLHYHFVTIPAQGGPVRYAGSGGLRILYFAILLTHVVGAILNLPMVLRTLWLAHRERWDEHRRLARRTFPLWAYVSVTGVLVYLMLYPWNPAPG